MSAFDQPLRFFCRATDLIHHLPKQLRLSLNRLYVPFIVTIDVGLEDFGGIESLFIASSDVCHLERGIHAGVWSSRLVANVAAAPLPERSAASDAANPP